MVTEAQVRKYALAMRGAEEKSHFAQPDFRVDGKIFCTIQPKHARSGLKLDPEQLRSLVHMDPEAFQGAKGFEKSGWTLVTWAKVTPAQMKALIADAWRQVAPKRVQAPPTPKPAPKTKAKRPPRRS